MIKRSKTVVFFGNERLATGVTTEAPTLQALIASGYHVAAVVANFERSTSRTARDLEIAQVAERHGIPLLLPKKLSEIKEQLAACNADAGILVAYGRIVPEDIISLFPKGILNIHPSLLPKHRGPTPIESAILNGDNKTGVSIMQLVKAMDAGPVYAQAEIPLAGDEAKQDLADRLLEIGNVMLLDLLPEMLAEDVVAIPQDDSRATYDNLLSKNDGAIDWNKPAEQIEREIRAFIGWPKSRAELAGIDVVIASSKVVKEQIGKPGSIAIRGKQFFVACGEGSLEIITLKPAGKNEMSAAAFLAGYGQRMALN